MEERRAAAVAPALGWAAIALGVFGLALFIAYQGHWDADFRVSVPIPARALVEPTHPAQGPARIDPVAFTDYRMGVWAFSRHAYTILSHPTQIFQTEPCHPVKNGLALHHPVITQGLVAVPGYLATGDPVATTNFLILASALLGAAAMALLVADWTAVPAAGLVAGLLYAFHPAQIGSPFHLGTKDFTWTILALFFARRLFGHRRWRDALGLGVSGCLQLATSFYPLLASATLALPMAAWLFWHHRRQRLPLVQLAAVAVGVGLFAAWLFSPYLELREAGVLQRNVRFFAPWSRFAPAGELFPGWICLALLGAALAWSRRRAPGAIDGDPRPALVVGALLLLLLATGGNMEARTAVLKGGEPPAVDLPNFFSLARAVVPGLDAIRLPSMLAHGVRMLLCILAGLGAAALLRSLTPRFAAVAGGALVLAAGIDTLRPGFLGLTPPVPFASLEIRPAEDAIRFFERLEEAGNQGPLLELPITGSPVYRFEQSPSQHLLTAYHHRRTSGCSPSYTPPEVRKLVALSRRVDAPGVLDEVRALGFTTLVVHHLDSHPGTKSYQARVTRLAQVSGGGLVEVLSTKERTAYELR